MHVHRLDDRYVSDLPEREKKRHPFPRKAALQALLSTQTLKKSDFRGPRMKLTKTVTAVDVIREATNMMNDQACHVARQIEAHIDFNSDCSELNAPTSPSTASNRSWSSSQSSLSSARSKTSTCEAAKTKTFDSTVEGYLNLIAGTLTVIIERGNNNVLCEAVEAVVAHLNFVDTLKLSLVRPLLMTYPTSSQVDLRTTKDGISASFNCLLGHSIPNVLLFSNISTILALENVITAQCLAPIFYCYWSCLHANLKEFAQDISTSTQLKSIRRQRYTAMFRSAEKEMEVQEARLYMYRYSDAGSWPDLPVTPSDTDSLCSYSSSATDDSIVNEEELLDDNFSVASDARQVQQTTANQFSFSLFRTKTPVIISKLATVYEQQEKQGGTKRWSLLLKTAA